MIILPRALQKNIAESIEQEFRQEDGTGEASSFPYREDSHNWRLGPDFIRIYRILSRRYYQVLWDLHKIRGMDYIFLIRQLECLLAGESFRILEAPALLSNHGLIPTETPDDPEIQELAQSVIAAGRVEKFVPASGEATRMFRAIIDVIQACQAGKIKDISIQNLSVALASPEINPIANSLKQVRDCIEHFEKFPFYEDLHHKMADAGLDLEDEIMHGDYFLALQYLLYEHGLDYTHRPKLLLRFHRNPDKTARTTYEEHLEEAVHFIGQQKKGRIHFSISPEHWSLVEQALIPAIRAMQKTRGIQLELCLSTQDPKTDTIALDQNGHLFLDQHGEVLLRKGGHGALIGNVNAIAADYIFIKNVDNVISAAHEQWDTIQRYHTYLIGQLVRIQKEVFGYLQFIERSGETLPPTKIQEIRRFIEHQLGYRFAAEASPTAGDLFRILNRPLRVAAMVANQGEPGGGPFWVRNGDGTSSLQIVESAEIHLADPEQRAIFERSTHFNPVICILGVRDYRGERFDLMNFIKYDAVFVTKKSYHGRELLALELPGLWNGAMYHWNSLFVEVPLAIFNPVKTILDLLRPAHQH